MKSKAIITLVGVLFITCYSNLAKASFAAWSSWSVSGLTPTNTVYLFTNKPTIITLQISCTRALVSGVPETGFDLKFCLASEDNSDQTLTIYNNFDITATDFEQYSPGSLVLNKTIVLSVDSRNQSPQTLSYSSFGLFEYTGGSTIPNLICASHRITYINSLGSFDQFPSRYSSTQFNYVISFPGISGTPITISDTHPVLVTGQSIYSPNQNNRLTLQTDGNLVLYKKNSNGTETAIWSSETQGKPSASLYLQSDGNLVIYPGTNTPVNHTPNSGLWGSNINANGLRTVQHAYYSLQDDGNFVFYWPQYMSYNGFINVIAGAADCQSGRSAHIGNLNHPLWSPVMQQAAGGSYTLAPL